mmetsp:Transcript_14185/g.29135  ORF Transcript_14185/g.29135 Transcript_14185/m.29135 type:complete len:205 (-) Transcript_14185:1079-1693(-)
MIGHPFRGVVVGLLFLLFSLCPLRRGLLVILERLGVAFPHAPKLLYHLGLVACYTIDLLICKFEHLLKALHLRRVHILERWVVGIEQPLLLDFLSYQLLAPPYSTVGTTIVVVPNSFFVQLENLPWPGTIPRFHRFKVLVFFPLTALLGPKHVGNFFSLLFSSPASLHALDAFLPYFLNSFRPEAHEHSRNDSGPPQSFLSQGQ